MRIKKFTNKKDTVPFAGDRAFAMRIYLSSVSMPLQDVYALAVQPCPCQSVHTVVARIYFSGKATLSVTTPLREAAIAFCLLFLAI